MKKFNVYSSETTYYQTTIETNSMEEARLRAEHEGNFNIGEDDLSNGDSNWHVDCVEEVEE